MRVNVYAEEMTDRVEIIAKEIDGHQFTGLRFYLYLPISNGDEHSEIRGPFIHRLGDDDSAAVTFWGKRDLRDMLRKALAMLDEHYGDAQPRSDFGSAGAPLSEEQFVQSILAFEFPHDERGQIVFTEPAVRRLVKKLAEVQEQDDRRPETSLDAHRVGVARPARESVAQPRSESSSAGAPQASFDAAFVHKMMDRAYDAGRRPAKEEGATREALELLKLARPYVSDAQSDEDPETQHWARRLLTDIDAALSQAPRPESEVMPSESGRFGQELHVAQPRSDSGSAGAPEEGEYERGYRAGFHAGLSVAEPSHPQREPPEPGCVFDGETWRHA